MNVVPRPGSLSTQMVPPLCVTIPKTVARPSPVPWPSGLVVKNGSKIRSRVAASIPIPVSLTASRTCGPGRTPTCSRANASSSSTLAVSMVTRPPRGMASRALTTRFMTTCSSWPGSASTPLPAPRETIESSTSSRITRRSIGASPSMTRVRSSTRGCRICLRLNARSWRVSAAARSPASSTRVRSRRAGSLGAARSRSSDVRPVMTVRRLLKSWATPPARRPIASIFCD